MYYMGFSIQPISICIKGILWTDFFLFSIPGQLDVQIYFPHDFLCHFVVVLFISFARRASADIERDLFQGAMLDSSGFICLNN